ncbi:MAG TPA: HD domain-containing phosphohydrolase [Blastocatellia bacterium]|nr:HD domain-containing phosphohydrolase [Blastocatellia bacterium]
MTIRLNMSDFNTESKCFWWGMTSIGTVVMLVSIGSLFTLTGGDWLKFALLCVLVFLASRRPLHIPNTEASVSVSDVFIFLAVFFLGTGPAVVLGFIDNFIAARLTAKRPTSWILAPNLMAITVLLSSTAFQWVLRLALGYEPEWPIGHAELPFPVLFPALVVLAFVQYLVNCWLVAWFYARRAGKSPYHFWRSGYLWTSWTFFGSAIAAGLIYFAIERYGFVYVGAAIPIIVASYFTYKVYFEHINEKTRHIDEVSRLHLSTVEALASAIDAKDQTTHGHVRRVQIYAEGLAKLFKLSNAEIEALRAGALLHDVGKLAVPDHILNKPGKLTAAEFEKMKIHTVVGAQILERVGFPYPVVPIVRHHHERWDGNGYPDELKGEDIPITARILSVVDCFDALHENRQYRRALTREEAIDFLRRNAASQFDPEVVRLFIQYLPQFEAQIAAQQVEEMERTAPLLLKGNGAVPAAGLSQEHLDVGSMSPPSYIGQINRAHQEVYALYEVARTFGSSLNFEDAMAIIANKLGYVVRFDTCVIYRYYESRGIAVAEHVTGAHADYLRGRCVVPGDGITGYVLANRKPFTHTDPMLDFADANLPYGTHYSAVAVFPLLKDGRLLGALALYSMTLADYTADDLRLLETVARIASDALDNALRYAETKSDAMTDLLTGLPNSRALQRRFAQEAARADRSGAPLFVLMLDLDNFKPINDTYGHQVGDDFLKAISSLLGSQFSKYDFFARYAGDEFVALIPQVSGEQFEELCDRLRRAVDQFAFCVRPMKYARVGISLGASLYGRDGWRMDELILAADRAMYANKYQSKLQTGTDPSNIIYMPGFSGTPVSLQNSAPLSRTSDQVWESTLN